MRLCEMTETRDAIAITNLEKEEMDGEQNEKNHEGIQNRRQVRLSVLCGEGKLKQLTALALTRVKGEKRHIAKRGDYRGANGREGANEKEKESEKGGDKENERALVPRGRDSIKRTHINESFQGKTELYAGASISTRVRCACTYTRALTHAIRITVAVANEPWRALYILANIRECALSPADPYSKRFVWITRRFNGTIKRSKRS